MTLDPSLPLVGDNSDGPLRPPGTPEFAKYIPIWDIGRCFAIIRGVLKDAAYRQRYRSFLVKLKTARQQAGLRQVEVARRLGRPQSFVSKCESGERRVDVVELQEFASLYEKPLSFFVN